MVSCVVLLSSSQTPGLIIGASIQQLTGRGGAGNFRSPSREPAKNGPEDYSDTRGRDPISSRDPAVVCDLLLLVSDTNSRSLKRS